jgi:hypothetical protein
MRTEIPKLPVAPLAAGAMLVAVSLQFCGCNQPPSSSVSTTKTNIDQSKILDLQAPTPFAIRITIFAYRDADARGWPAARPYQDYVRFLQDRNVRVGFKHDPESDLRYAMVDSGDVDAVVAADKEAVAAGIKKPPTVPSGE